MNVQAEIEAGRALIAKLPHVLDSALIGSAMYLPEDQVHDVDFAVLVYPNQHAIDYTQKLCDEGWGRCGEYDGQGGTWAAIRRDNLNLMVSHDPELFKGYKIAMEVCKALNLQHKEDRIAVCAIVRDGKKADEVFTHARIYGEKV